MAKETVRILLTLLLALLLVIFYWVGLLNTQRSQEAHAEAQVRVQAMRLAEALAVQVETLFSGLSYLNDSLATNYLVDSKAYFTLAV